MRYIRLFNGSSMIALHILYCTKKKKKIYLFLLNKYIIHHPSRFLLHSEHVSFCVHEAGMIMCMYMLWWFECVCILITETAFIFHFLLLDSTSTKFPHCLRQASSPSHHLNKNDLIFTWPCKHNWSLLPYRSCWKRKWNKIFSIVFIIFSSFFCFSNLLLFHVLYHRKINLPEKWF